MTSQTLYHAPRKSHVAKIRCHDYLYDPAYIVSGARDYARTAFKAAMDSAQKVVQPVYNAMFSDLRKFPRVHIVYHANCRLPNHIDRSYDAYVERGQINAMEPPPDLTGKDRFIFSAIPKKVPLVLKSATPDFRPPSSRGDEYCPSRPVNKKVQTLYRESSAQTHPWEPDGVEAEICKKTPEVLYLDKLEWGPGKPYRIGDLPADFHTTEIINKMRHARAWTELAEKGNFPKWMKKRDAIITDIETRDWIFREAEIDELQDIRLTLLHKLQDEQRKKKANRSSKKLSKLWQNKKEEMERKVSNIHRTRDRELRKLKAIRSGGGRIGLVQSSRTARGGGPIISATVNPASDLYAPIARNGYQARRKHADITYDLSLLGPEDHRQLSAMPAWLKDALKDLLPKTSTQLCERETKWSEQFLENLHNELKKARLGAAVYAAPPIRLLKPRKVEITPRPATPEVEGVNDSQETFHQSALMLQRIIRGRAVQNLMFEGRTQATELIEELKSTHGLQNEDKIRIAEEEIGARDYDDHKAQFDRKEAAVTALVEELCGSAISTALDFLEKELKRLQEERRQHAFILIAMREKCMREAAEAGRRQKEVQRRKEHDEMFRQIVGVTQETVDAYFYEIVQAGVDHSVAVDAERYIRNEGERMDNSLKNHGSMSTAEQVEMVGELVHQFLLPEAHKAAAREAIDAQQKANLVAARDTIFGTLDDAQVKEVFCTKCGVPAGVPCRCKVCPTIMKPVEKPEYRGDPRWKYTRRRDAAKPKTKGEKYPPYHEFRCMLNVLVDEAVKGARRHTAELKDVKIDYGVEIKEKIEVELDAKAIVERCVDEALGVLPIPPVKDLYYRHLMTRKVGDAMDRSVPLKPKKPCPEDLPSEIRKRAEDQARLEGRVDFTCKCEEDYLEKIKAIEDAIAKEKSKMLPSELRILEELKRCKCDPRPAPSPATTGELETVVEEQANEVVNLDTNTEQPPAEGED